MEQYHSQQFAVAIPVLNGGQVWRAAARALTEQTIEPKRVLVVDSGSTDDSVAVAHEAGFEVLPIDKSEFDHGDTRQRAAEQLHDCEIVVFLTHDAVLAEPSSLEKLIAAFDDPKVGIAYGRQLPRQGASPVEAHARLFNYPARSETRSADDIPIRGIKTAFCSDSYAAYRCGVLRQVGGFPEKNIVSEDMYVAAKMLLAGWKIAYVANAPVYHSHNYTHLQEFRRYFDIGVFQNRQSWIRERFGGAEGEGLRYVKSEVAYIARINPIRVPDVFLRLALKWLGYRLGLFERFLSPSIKKALSASKHYWN